LIWLLPLAFVIHDAEEFATRKVWLAEHGPGLHLWLQRMIGSDPLAPLQAMSDGAVLRAMGAIALLLVAATAAFHAVPNRVTRALYLVVLGGFFIHGFAHLAQAAALGGYTPGVATAALVVIPASVLIHRAMSRSEPISGRTWLATAGIGAILIVPAILLALRLGGA
jgi:hypothetical protein